MSESNIVRRPSVEFTVSSPTSGSSSSSSATAVAGQPSQSAEQAIEYSVEQHPRIEDLTDEQLDDYLGGGHDSDASSSASELPESGRRLSIGSLPSIHEEHDGPGGPVHFSFERLELEALSRSASQSSGLSVGPVESREAFINRRPEIGRLLNKAEQTVFQYCKGKEFKDIPEDDARALRAFQTNYQEAANSVGDLLADSDLHPDIRDRAVQLQKDFRAHSWTEPSFAQPVESARARRKKVGQHRNALTPSDSRTPAGSAKPSPKPSPKHRPQTPSSPTTFWSRVFGAKDKSAASSSGQGVAQASPRSLPMDVNFIHSFRQKDAEYHAFKIFAERSFAAENPDFLETVEQFEQAGDADKPALAEQIMKKSRADVWSPSVDKHKASIEFGLKELLPPHLGKVVGEYAVEPPPPRESDYGFGFDKMSLNSQLARANVSFEQAGALHFAFKAGAASTEFKDAVKVARDEIFELVQKDVWMRYLNSPERPRLLAQLPAQQKS